MNIVVRFLCTLVVALACGCSTRAPAGVSTTPAAGIDPDSVHRALLRARAEVAGLPLAPAARIRRMRQLGMWEQVDSVAAASPPREVDALVALAELRFAQHRYPGAAEMVARALVADPAHREGRLLRARLRIQAWDLGGALAEAQALLRRRRRDAGAAEIVGRVLLLEKRYEPALQWARRIQAWEPRNAAGYLLEADVRFWNQDPAGAEVPLVRALQLDPWSADAHFAYGYAVWRRVDATQLGRMAAHWNLALALDPLHYFTHWHFGNGHTHLTYADYAHPTDDSARTRLAEVDSLIAAGRLEPALERARDLDREFPQSVLPSMIRGSAFYMAYGMDRSARLDSAEAVFRGVLARKPNYGPAHNAVAAVIKQRQFTVLERFDSLEAEIDRTQIPDDSLLSAVFPDVRYYPGTRVRKMVVQQLGPSMAYLPMLQRMGRVFRIPPLHRDLAEAMGDPFFRTATTFDNRQWMDIRGVGSGAAGIEYVERASHQEREVPLHEFVHLFHQMVFTDREVRRVRELYHEAMRAGRTLDYYAANNEHEFLAQAYPAFFSPVKVHPLNHKAMNTRDDLWRRDPETYRFVDSLVARQRAYLAGDPLALRSNWAQVFVNLSERARSDGRAPAAERLQRAGMLLDSALVWDPRYLPAMLSYAALQREGGRLAEAGRWLARAEALEPDHPRVLAGWSELLAAEHGFSDRSLDQQASLLRRALSLETDLAERAALSARVRDLYLAYGRVPEAISAAREYASSAPTISTYLRDRRDEAIAFAAVQRALLGYGGEAVPVLRRLVEQKPQQYELRAQLADALVVAGALDEAAATLEEARRILAAARRVQPAILIRLAEVRLLQNDTAAARAVIGPLLKPESERAGGDPRLVRVLIELGENTEASLQLERGTPPESPLARAELAYTRGVVSQWRGDAPGAERLFRETLSLNPYHRTARVALVRLLAASGRGEEVRALVNEAASLPVPLGPDFHREVARSARSA